MSVTMMCYESHNKFQANKKIPILELWKKNISKERKIMVKENFYTLVVCLNNLEQTLSYFIFSLLLGIIAPLITSKSKSKI